MRATWACVTRAACSTAHVRHTERMAYCCLCLLWAVLAVLRSRCCVSAVTCMLKRGPTRIELRGEGAEQIEQEYQQAKANRQAAQGAANIQATLAANRALQQQQQQHTQQQQQPTTRGVPASAAQTPSIPSFLPSSAAHVTPAPRGIGIPLASSSLVDESTSSFFSDH